MHKKLKISGVIALLYFASIFLLAIYPQKSLETLFFGLFLASAGSLISWILLRESNLKKRIIKQRPTPSQTKEQVSLPNPNQEAINFKLSELQGRTQELISLLNQKEEELLKLTQEKALFDHRIEDLHHEMETLKCSTEEELRRKTTLLSEYQETINQQREVLKKRQDQVSELEIKVNDLNYEVKTLLQLAEMGQKKEEENRKKEGENPVLSDQDEEPFVPTSNPLVKTQEEATFLLKRCVDIAQKITAASHFSSGNSRFQNISLNNYALDLRRLFDNLRSETTSSIIVYSQKENRILFANNQIRNLLGWNIDKFTQHFSHLIQEGEEDWKSALNTLTSSQESRARLVFKTRNGQNLLVHCQLRAIPTGVFRYHAIGVIYPA